MFNCNDSDIVRIDSVQFQIQTQKQSQLSTGNMFIAGSDMLSNVEGIAPVGPGFNEPHYCTDSEERCVSIGPSNRLDPLGSSLGPVYKVGVERGDGPGSLGPEDWLGGTNAS